MSIRCAIILCACAMAPFAWAGPPFITDDPEPVEYRHGEFYIASYMAHDTEGWSGTAPHVEVNYGAFTNGQLHVIAPMAFVAPDHGPAQFGYGDTEVGIKYRFMEETSWRPQIGTFPQIEIPTGDSARDLGGGQTRMLLPIWLQKRLGSYTTYGGGGYWINPGAGNFDWWFLGWVLQYQICARLTLGAEILHATVQETGGSSYTQCHAGGVFDVSDAGHLLFSAGPTIQGPSGFQGYVAFLLTFGPKKLA